MSSALVRGQGADQIEVTRAGKSGWLSHHFSNLKSFGRGWVFCPVSITSGEWSPTAVETTWTEERGKFWSHSLDAKNLSTVARIRFFYWLFAHMKILLEGLNSIRTHLWKSKIYTSCFLCLITTLEWIQSALDRFSGSRYPRWTHQDRKTQA
jgi:hypothetical protein